MSRFGKKGKLSPCFVGPFEILERIGELAHRVTQPLKLSNIHDVFHVSMLRKYESDPAHVLDFEVLDIDENVKYVEESMQILDCREQVLRNKTIPLVKVLWRYHNLEKQHGKTRRI